MTLVPMKTILNTALKHQFAVGAFNVHTPNQIKAAIEIHELFRAPAILQVIEFSTGFMAGRKDFLQATIDEKVEGIKKLVEVCMPQIQEASIPIALHLDHGSDPELVKKCVDLGFSSVMIDGSHLPFEENIRVTKEIVDYAHGKGVTVEGELGVLAGREDHAGNNHALYTDPNKVCEFFERTHVDALAISYGTSHGATKGKDVVIRKEIAIAAYENMRHKGITGSLVSHGSSTVPAYLVKDINRLGGDLQNAHGIPLEQVLEVIPYGISKINVGTDLRLAIVRNVRDYFSKHPEQKQVSVLKEIWGTLEKNPSMIDERVYLQPIMDDMIVGKPSSSEAEAILEAMENGVKEMIGQQIVYFGQVGYADQVERITLEEMTKLY